MKKYHLLPIAAATLAALGLSSNAQADLAYGIAYDNIFNLTVRDSAGTLPGDITSFLSTSRANATLGSVSDGDGVSTPGPTRYVVANVPTGTRTAGFAQLGNIGSSYSSGAAQILSTELQSNPTPPPAFVLSGTPTQAVNIAETNIVGDGSGNASSSNSSTTGFTFTFILPTTTAITLDFNANAYMEALLGPGTTTGSSASSSLTQSFSLTGATSNPVGFRGNVFNWTPDGVVRGGITGGTETFDAFSLNTNVAASPGNRTPAPYVPDTVNGKQVGVVTGLTANNLNRFQATTIQLDPGSYTLVIAMGEGSDATSVQRAEVPEPASLGFLGIGLLGLSLLRRRHLQA